MPEAKTAQEYLLQPYARVLVPEVGGGFSARILEFPGCVAEGQTRDEALEALERVAESWLEVALALGHVIVEPLATQEYSGKIALRVPPWLHEQLVRIAEIHHISANQFIVAAIAEKVGQHGAVSQIIPPIREIVGESICDEALARLLPIRELVDQSIRAVAVERILPSIREIVDETIRQVAVTHFVPPIREIVAETVRQVAVTQLIPLIRDIVDQTVSQVAVTQILLPIRGIVDETIRQVTIPQMLVPIREIVDESIRQMAVAQILAPMRELVGETLRQVVENRYERLPPPA